MLLPRHRVPGFCFAPSMQRTCVNHALLDQRWEFRAAYGNLRRATRADVYKGLQVETSASVSYRTS